MDNAMRYHNRARSRRGWNGRIFWAYGTAAIFDLEGWRRLTPLRRLLQVQWGARWRPVAIGLGRLGRARGPRTDDARMRGAEVVPLGDAQ